MSDQIFACGWSNFDFTLTSEAKDAFETAMPPLFGAKYTPLAFASRVVAGIDYCFLCEVQYIARFPDENTVKVYIHQPQSGRPTHYRIIPIHP